MPVVFVHDTIRYDTVDLRALKSWRDGQLNLAHSPETKNNEKIKIKNQVAQEKRCTVLLAPYHGHHGRHIKAMLSPVHTSDNVAKNRDIVAETRDIVAKNGNNIEGAVDEVTPEAEKIC